MALLAPAALMENMCSCLCCYFWTTYIGIWCNVVPVLPWSSCNNKNIKNMSSLLFSLNLVYFLEFSLSLVWFLSSPSLPLSLSVPYFRKPLAMTPRVTQSHVHFLLLVGTSHPLLAKEFLDTLTCKIFCFSLTFLFVIKVSSLWRKNHLNPKAGTCQKSCMIKSVKAEHSSSGVALSLTSVYVQNHLKTELENEN